MWTKERVIKGYKLRSRPPGMYVSPFALVWASDNGFEVLVQGAGAPGSNDHGTFHLFRVFGGEHYGGRTTKGIATQAERPVRRTT